MLTDQVATPEIPEATAEQQPTQPTRYEPPEEQQPEEQQTPSRKVVRILDKEYDFDPDFPDDKIKRFEDFHKNLYTDYQTKTNRISEERQQFEGYKQAQMAELQFRQQLGEEFTELQKVQKDLEPYLKITTDQWKQAAAADEAATSRALAEMNALMARRGVLMETVGSKQNMIKQAESQRMQAILERGQQFLAEKIPDLTAEKKQALVDFGSKSYGFTPEELANTIDPRAVMVLHDAYLYRQSLQKAVKESEPAPAKPQPAAKVGVSATAQRNPDDMSVEDWVKWREGQIRKNRGR